MRKAVTKRSIKEYLKEVRPRYHGASRKEQGTLLDEMMKVRKFNRKYLNRVLNKKVVRKPPGSEKKAGRPNEYHAPEILVFLLRVWHASNQACSKCLKAVLCLWLPKYEEATGVVLSLEHQVSV